MRGDWMRHTTVILGCVALFAAAAAAMSWPWWEYAFLSDDSPMAWLSSALLLANAAVALNLSVSRSLPPRFGGFLAAALAYLALDEQFRLHERMKETIGTGRWADMPVLLVGAGGLVFLVILLRVVKGTSSRLLLASGVAVGLFALWVDLGKPPVMIARTEELYEVCAEALFLSGLIDVGRSHVQSSS